MFVLLHMLQSSVDLIRVLSSNLAFVMSSALSPTLIAQIDRLVQKFEQGHNLVKIGQQILELLRSEGHVQRLTLPPKCVGVHPANRDGMGISARDCHALLDDILSIGFVSNRVNAVATEVCSDEQRLWNERLVSAAGGSLGECRGQELKALSLSASHTNFCLRIMLDSVQHDGGEVTLDGRLSMECLRMKDAGFHEAATKGLTWDVVPKMVIDQWPCLPALIQEAMWMSTVVNMSCSCFEGCTRCTLTEPTKVKQQIWMISKKSIGFQATFCQLIGLHVAICHEVFWWLKSSNDGRDRSLCDESCKGKAFG